MKLFARQLIHKHQCLQEYVITNDASREDGRSTTESVARVERELDDLIGFNMFLMVAGLEQRSSKVCVCVYMCVCCPYSIIQGIVCILFYHSA